MKPVAPFDGIPCSTNHWHSGRLQGLGCGMLERVGRSGDGGKALLPVPACGRIAAREDTPPCAFVLFPHAILQLSPHTYTQTFLELKSIVDLWRLILGQRIVSALSARGLSDRSVLRCGRERISLSRRNGRTMPRATYSLLR